jgi:hypothetical protein
MRTQSTGFLEIVEARHLSGYRLRLTFCDGMVRIVDFRPFLRKATHPDLTQYRQLRKFKAFRLHHGDLMWGDYEMIFPVADLHEGRI